MLVACLKNTCSISSFKIPQPLSDTVINALPPCCISILIASAPASIEFSTSSFTIEAPYYLSAAILFIVVSSSRLYLAHVLLLFIIDPSCSTQKFVYNLYRVIFATSKDISHQPRKSSIIKRSAHGHLLSAFSSMSYIYICLLFISDFSYGDYLGDLSSSDPVSPQDELLVFRSCHRPLLFF